MHELIAPSINFFLVVALLTYLLRKPLKEMIATRKSGIQSQVEEAKVQKLEAERKHKEFTERLNNFESEARQILEKAKQDAEALKAKIITDAQASADRIVKDANATAQANIQEYKDQLRKETIAKAVELAEKIVKDRLSADDQRRIVNEYVGKVQ